MKEFQDLGMISYSGNRQLTIGEMVSYLVMLLTGAVDSTDGVDDGTKVTSSNNQPDVVPLCVDLVLNWLLNVYDQYVLPGHFSFTLLGQCLYKTVASSNSEHPCILISLH
jgi:hypothetical protein